MIRLLSNYRLAVTFGRDDVKTRALQRLVELHDSSDKSIRNKLEGFTAVEVMSWCDLRQSRLNALNAIVDRHFNCKHDGLLLKLNPIVKQRLSQTPSASAIDWSLVDNVSPSSSCGWGCCSRASIGSRMIALKRYLADPNLFAG
ncbi:hypothetical protein CALCODRAFT_381488 [Calocera cornea HHB12733]|uniref:Uncharacterized protein n=1 Tax=Calocera cornea HHB12733 TaxID=1353952 RepID=A0A165ED77_9BASI|nr:hypothetical protein CALCODRAFT_381488 [Calocera cornea HHB12733]